MRDVWNMKKWLRKKKHLKEFTELGFTLAYTLDNKLKEKPVKKLNDEILEKIIEANNLYFGGIMHYETEGFVTANRGSVTENQRAKVAELIVSLEYSSHYYISPLKNAWYSQFNEKIEWKSVSENNNSNW